jgi:hypothetical protein
MSERRRHYVVHLSGDTHARAKEYCATHGTKLARLVEDLIAERLSVVERRALEPTEFVALTQLRVVAVGGRPTKRKQPDRWCTLVVRAASQPEPWSKPPFWSKS